MIISFVYISFITGWSPDDDDVFENTQRVKLLNIIYLALNDYKINYGNYPTQLEKVLHNKYITKELIDKYEYNIKQEKFLIEKGIGPRFSIDQTGKMKVLDIVNTSVPTEK